MIRKKLKLFYKSLVRIFFKFLYGEILLPKTTNDLIRKIDVDNSLFKTFKNGKYQIYIVKNARIYTDNNENVAIIKKTIQSYQMFHSNKYTGFCAALSIIVLCQKELHLL